MGIFGAFAKVNKMNKEIEQNKDKYKDDLFTVVITSSLDDRKKSRAASIVKTWLGGSSSDIKELMNGSVPIEVRKHLSYEKAYKAIFNLKDEDIDAELVNETANGSSAAVVAEPYDVSEVPEENAPAADNEAQLAQAGPEEAQAEKATDQQVQAVLAAVKAKLEKEKTEKAAAEQAQAELAAAKAELEKAQAEKAAAEQTQAELATVKAELEQAQAELAVVKAELEKAQAEKAAAEQVQAELAAAKVELEKAQAEKIAAEQAQAEFAAKTESRNWLEKRMTERAQRLQQRQAERQAEKAAAERARVQAELEASKAVLKTSSKIASLGDSPDDYDLHENYAISKDGEKLVVSGNDDIKDRQFENGAFEKVVILDGVKSIGRCAFDDCSNLTDIEIADSVTEIKEYAFSGCKSLEKLTMPAELKMIGNDAFPFENLESVDLSKCSKLKKVDLGVFRYVKNILLPNVVERIIGKNAEIQEFMLPPSFKKINACALRCQSIYCYSRDIESPYNLLTCSRHLYLLKDVIEPFIDFLDIEDDVTETIEYDDGWAVYYKYHDEDCGCYIFPIPEEKLYVYDD